MHTAQRRQTDRFTPVTLFELGSVVGALGGAICLAFALAGQGALLALLGIIAGALSGWFLGPFVVLGVFAVAITIADGPKAAGRFLRRRKRSR